MAAAALESPAFAAPNSSLLDSQPQRMETDGDLGVGAAVGSGPTVTGATPSASKMDNTETSLPPTAPRATAPQPNASPNMDAPLSAPTPVHFSFPPSVRLPPIATSPPRTAPPASSQPEPTSPYSSRDYEARSAAISAASALLFLRHSPHPASPHSDSGSFFDSPYPGRFGTPPLRGRERDRDRDRVDRPSSTPPSVVGFSLSAYSAQLNDDSGSISGPGTSGPIVPPPRSRASQSPSPYPYSHAVIEGEPGQRLRRACESCRQLRVPCDGGKRPGCGRCVGKGRLVVWTIIPRTFIFHLLTNSYFCAFSSDNVCTSPPKSEANHHQPAPSPALNPLVPRLPNPVPAPGPEPHSARTFQKSAAARATTKPRGSFPRLVRDSRRVSGMKLGIVLESTMLSVTWRLNETLELCGAVGICSFCTKGHGMLNRGPGMSFCHQLFSYSPARAFVDNWTNTELIILLLNRAKVGPDVL